jgi:dolichol-phosphate mannosyltransferase
MHGPPWVILPTYDEADNVEPMVRAVRAALAAEDVRVLVVDDASPDGTGAIADRLAAALPGVGVLHRPGKEGLGQAYVAGFEHALERGAGFVFEMDCDFSHDPAYLPLLLRRARAGADLVLGSRYVPGGGVENWDRVRRTLSRAGSHYARTVLGVGTRDLTGGFKCFRAATLEAVDYRSVRSQGYAFQVELTWRALRAGLRVEEVPIVFRERRDGASKMTPRIALEAAWLVPSLRLATPLHYLKRPQSPALPGGTHHMAGTISDVTDTNFQAEVLEADAPVLVDFWAPWCGPCRMVAPVLEEISRERDDMRIVKLNIDDNQQTASQYGVMSIPTMILFRHGQPAKTIIGAKRKPQLLAELEPALVA